MMVDYGAMEGHYGKYFPLHLQALQTPREGFCVAEGKERVRRALRMSTRKVYPEFMLGDTVEYFMDHEAKHRPGWRQWWWRWRRTSCWFATVLDISGGICIL